MTQCDGKHVEKQIGVFDNKVTGESLKVFRCVVCNTKRTEKVKI